MNGLIDDQFKFEDIDKQIKKISIRMDNVSYINSYGIKMWVQWLQRIRKDAILILSGVRPKIISSINTVNGFTLSSTTVQTLYAPYISKNGEECKEVLLEFGKNYFLNQNPILPEIKDEFGQEMSPDFTPSSFFRFLKT